MQHTADTPEPLQVWAPPAKRIIVCCDGTWEGSNGDPPSNVTRIARILRRTCSDGSPQVISYFPGVGAGILDRCGGILGLGLQEDIREAYNFVCTNYVDGDSIVLVGFARGAFVARSVADFISALGLLTPAGMARFHTILDDYQQIVRTPEQRWGRRLAVYRRGLRGNGYTRDTLHDDKTGITVKAVAVWETVGALGIPPAPIVGIRGSAEHTSRFSTTEVPVMVENAFQALALDEPRRALRPALWERPDGPSANLRQVWFPGSHEDVGGGGSHDQQIANLSLAWMCDQLSAVGVEFNTGRMAAVFLDGLRFSAAHPFPHIPVASRLLSKGLASSASELLWGAPNPRPWAVEPVYYHHAEDPERDSAECSGGDGDEDDNDSGYYEGEKQHHHRHPNDSPQRLWDLGARPWGLGLIRRPTGLLAATSAKVPRRPGQAVRADPDGDDDDDESGAPLLSTNERVHSSVRVRLACGGLGPDDERSWRCPALRGRGWVLERGCGLSATEEVDLRHFQPRELRLDARRYPEARLYPVEVADSQWRWVRERRDGGLAVLPEEPLVGYWERLLLALTAGDPDVWRWAQRRSHKLLS